MQTTYLGFSIFQVDSSTYGDYNTSFQGSKAIPVDDDALTIVDAKIEEGTEVYGLMTDIGGNITFLSEKVALGADAGAMSAFAEATFAAALALVAISGF